MCLAKLEKEGKHQGSRHMTIDDKYCFHTKSGLGNKENLKNITEGENYIVSGKVKINNHQESRHMTIDNF